ncbi:enoyl-CoA hydratase/isomerase family protein [Primorskyibacter sp. S87]|uniref:enoyl-CoA hydratase/isomerase family protein n=1 Tax=Primorskyibacter sp. S87 TaxID=3415126 RepID=UPI003C7B5F5A
MLPVSDQLHLDHNGDWLTAWFNTPERRNPLTAERVEALIALCVALQNSDMRGVIFRGQGGIFCAGGDLKAFQGLLQGTVTKDEVIGLSLRAADLFDAVSGLPQFTVMAVEGAAMAGGFGLACCGDYVVAEDDARFGISEVRIGVTPAQIAPFVLARLGARHGRRMMLMGDTVSGEGACSVGLVDQLVPPGDMNDALVGLRRQMAGIAPGALAALKRQIATIPNQTRKEQRKTAAECFADAMLSNEAREGIAAFLDKRKPQWAESE